MRVCSIFFILISHALTLLPSNRRTQQRRAASPALQMLYRCVRAFFIVSRTINFVLECAANQSAPRGLSKIEYRALGAFGNRLRQRLVVSHQKIYREGEIC